MSTELLVARQGGELWSLLREQGRDLELRIEPPPSGLALGAIYKGRVADSLPGMRAVFVDLGTDRNGFLPATRSGPAGAAGEIRAGREILVQVQREPMGGKGARLSGSPTLAGRRLVLLPLDRRRSVSRRLEDPGERTRIEGLLADLPGDVGFIARTAATGASATAIAREGAALLEDWLGLEARAARTPAPLLLHEEPDLLVRGLRDGPPEGYSSVVVDDDDDFRRARAYLERVDPGLVIRVVRHDPPGSLHAAMRPSIEKALRRRVWLRSGGFIVIERTEALVSIDVNTGKDVGTVRGVDAALRTNLEAAAEVARRLRLLDLGGLVVIDFVQMRAPAEQRQVREALRAALAPDPARTRLGDFGEFGLVELARERLRPGPMERLSRPCEGCEGRGLRLRDWTDSDPPLNDV